MNEHDGVLLGEPREELAQRREGAPAQLLRVRDLEDAAPGSGDRLDASQDGEEPRQRQDVARKRARAPPARAASSGTGSSASTRLSSAL